MCSMLCDKCVIIILFGVLNILFMIVLCIVVETCNVARVVIIVACLDVFTPKWIVCFVLMQHHCDIITFQFFLLFLQHLMHQTCCHILHNHLSLASYSRLWSSMCRRMARIWAKLLQRFHFSETPPSKQVDLQVSWPYWRGPTSHHFFTSYIWMTWLPIGLMPIHLKWSKVYQFKVFEANFSVKSTITA